MDTRFEWVSTTCRELLKARRERKITQDQLDYELAKVTLEMLPEYEPKFTPHKPLDLRRFESLKGDDIARMSKTDYEKMAAHASESKRQWLTDSTKLKDINGSNLFWLQNVKKILEEKGHERVKEVEHVIYQHQSAVYA